MKLSTKLLLASILPVISITWWQIKNPLREYGFDWLCYENYSPSCNLYFQSKNCFENPINSGDNENHVFSGSGWLIFGQPLKWELYIDNVSPGDDISFPLERISFYPLLKRRNSKLYGEVTSEVRKEKNDLYLLVRFKNIGETIRIWPMLSGQNPPSTDQKMCAHN
jgi:hypothetical protein